MYNRILISTAREFPFKSDFDILSMTATRFERWEFWQRDPDPLDGHYTKKFNGFHYNGHGTAVVDFVLVGKNGYTLPEMRMRQLERMGL